MFVSGYRDYFISNPSEGVGHVGMATGEGTIIHAANKKSGVIEVPLADFCGNDFRGVTRIVPDLSRLLVFETPLEREVETSDDIRWIIAQRL